MDKADSPDLLETPIEIPVQKRSISKKYIIFD